MLQATLKIKCNSLQKLNDLISFLNPDIEIEYLEDSEIELFKQRLHDLEKENFEFRAMQAENKPALQAATFSPQSTYEKKTGKINIDFGKRFCEFPECGKIFTKTHNRNKFCSEHQSKKVKKPEKTTG